MTKAQALKRLKALGDEKVRKLAVREGAIEQFGAPLGEIRKIAKEIKSNHALGLQLWETGNADARLLAVLLMKPKQLTNEELDELVRSVCCWQVADWINAYIVKKHPGNEELRVAWMDDDNAMAARAGWNLTYERIQKDADGLDLKGLLDRIEAEMADADRTSQWTMNFALAAIGIHHAKHRKRALKIGEKLGVFADYPTAKGCTSPYAPIWINEMVSRQEAK